jgi:hypothetical protein
MRLTTSMRMNDSWKRSLGIATAFALVAIAPVASADPTGLCANTGCGGVTVAGYCAAHTGKEDIPQGAGCCSTAQPDACDQCIATQVGPSFPKSCANNAVCALVWGANPPYAGLFPDSLCCQGTGTVSFYGQCTYDTDCCLGNCNGGECCGDQGQVGNSSTGKDTCACQIDGTAFTGVGNCCSHYSFNSTCYTKPQHYCLQSPDCGPQAVCATNTNTCCLSVNSTQSCTVGADCCSGKCNNPGPQGTCAPVNAVGGQCQVDADCGAGFECDNYVCAAISAAGGPCTAADDCAPGGCALCNGNKVCAVNPVCDLTPGTLGLRGTDTCCSQPGTSCALPVCGPINAPCCGACDSTTSQCVQCLQSGHGTCLSIQDCCSGLVCDIAEGICESCDADKECGDITKYACKSQKCCSISGQPCGIGTNCCSGACGSQHFCP